MNSDPRSNLEVECFLSLEANGGRKGPGGAVGGRGVGIVEFYNVGNLDMNKENIVELIARFVRQTLPGLDMHTFLESDRLVDLGANSVDRAEIVMLVQESLSLSIPRVELSGPGNIGELADLLLRKLRAV